ncbi:MOSC domain protein [Aspergillus lucknowensis]|uniref:MOSC domain-containing protein n=1 Tax=Aspergillus lucknowensis TaxID=176173 RepID=A0ABR4LRV6_9EURO
MLEDSTQQNAAIVNTVLAISGALLFTFWAITRSSSNGAPKGCRMLGLPLDQSNLSDEYDPKWVDGVPAPSTDAQGRPAWRVKALFTYPIKSCAGIELDIAHVVSTGFLHDRQFCFAENVKSTQASQIDRCASGENQSTNWVARTLRNSGFNKLALVRPEIWVPDPSAPGYTPDLEQVKSQGVLVVYYPHIGRNILHSALLGIGICLGLIPCETSFHIPLKPPPDQETTYSLTPVKIWKDSPLAYDYGKHIPDSFHRFLACSGTEQRRENGRITLFRVCSSSHREIFRNAPRKKDLGFQPTTGFADAYPIHLLSLSSVRDVAARCAIAIPHLSIRRFRANVIIQGPGAFAEDDWKRIRILPSSTSTSSSSSSSSSLNGILREGKRDTEGTIIHTVCRTIRCKLPNVDPDTGVRHPAEPDATLRSYRRIDPGETRYACLGMQGVPAVQEFQIRVGDAISVLETGEHVYIKMLAPGEIVEGV